MFLLVREKRMTLYMYVSDSDLHFPKRLASLMMWYYAMLLCLQSYSAVPFGLPTTQSDCEMHCHLLKQEYREICQSNVLVKVKVAKHSKRYMNNHSSLSCRVLPNI